MYHRTRASSVHYPIAKKTKDSSNGMINLAEVGGPPPHISGGPAAGLPHMMPTPVVAGAGIAMMGQHHQQQQQQSSQQQQQQSHPSQRLVGGVSHQLPPSGMHHPHGPPPPPPGVSMGGAPHHLTPAGGAPQTRSGSARERAMHAVEYYKSNVRRARVDAGLARNSLHERYSFVQRQMATMGNGGGGVVGTKLSPHGPTDHLYRSNSSLELIHDHGGAGGLPDHLHTGGGTNLRREYGSHGSIDVISSDRHPHHHHHHQGQGGGAPSAGENFLTMLQEYQPFGLDASSLLYSLGKHHSGHGHGNGAAPASSNITLTGDDVVDRGGNASPKLRNKFHRLWGSSNGASAAGSANGSANGKRQVANGGAAAAVAPGTASLDDSQLCMALNVSASSTTTTVSSADIEERQRRRAFAHFDCRSLTANLGYAAKLRGFLLERRRNTTTGASAAATYGTRSSTPDGDSVDEDYGDGQQNELLENCPFFRNEIGGEEEREVSLTRMASSTTSSSSSGASGAGQQRRAIHRPALAYGVSVLECGANDTLWKGYTCPYQKGPRPIEQIDNGALYYRQYFFGQEHQNWFGMDEHLGPVAISIKREKLNPAPVQTLALHGSDVAPTTTHQGDQYLYRLIVRTSELLTLRGSVIEDSIPNARGAGKHANTKEILEYVAPEVQIGCLRLAVGTPQCEQQLLKLDEQGLTNKYKVGILYCRAGQSSEEDMYNNEEAGPAFNEFLDTIGRRVRLKGFEHYKAGLDNKTDSTGTHSLYATHQDCEIMFHVSTMLPFTPNNRQQLLRKRHIGNDIVTIVFQEPGALPFTPKNIRSQFQHVFVIVRAVNPCSEHTQYRVAVSRSKDVPVFGPPVRAGSHYPRGKQFGEFLLSKVINAENAAHRSVKFAMMAIRTRQEYLKDLATNYSTAQVVETGQRFSIFPSKKRERPTKPRFSGDLSQRGAFCWQVVLHDSGQSTQVDCFLGISAETFVLIEECTRQIIFVTPCRAILGWSTSQNALRVYYHQGECVTLNMRDTGDRDEQLEVIERLRAVTNGCGALELSLRRNPMGQLGFHVQPDGVVTQVEISGQAWAAGLRQGYRLVEICKVAVATLSHDQMVDLLKTSAQVTVTVIESFADFTPRRGCTLQNCRFNSINYENEYDSMMLEGGSGGGGSKNGSSGQNGASSGSIGSSSSSSKKGLPGGQLQSSASHRRRYERNFSPPRSSNSSGYGTGSSSRSFTAAVGASGPQQVAGAAAAAAAASSGVAQPNGPDMGTLTSSSSGHSSNDERWYDVLDPPQEASSLMAAGPPSVASDPSVNYHHPKLTSSSNSLPLAGSSPRPLSLHNEGGPMSASPARSNGGQQSGAANGQSVGRDNSANIALLKRLIIADSPNGEAQQQQQHHQQQQNHPEPLYSSSLKNLSNHHLLMSAAGNHVEEDDLSRHNSPQLRRSATTTNIYGINGKKANGAVANCSGSSASSSRNNSPRPNGQGEPAKLRGGAALKGGAQHHPQRNSVNYTTGSTLQEDLMKLINPDYIANDDNFNAGGLERMQKGHHNSHSLGNIASLAGGLKPIPQKSRSREGVNLGGSNQQLSAANGGSGLKLANGGTNSPSNSNGGEEEVIFTTARPATVISSTTSNSSSPASELLGKHHMNEDHLKMSPSRKQQHHQQQQQQQQFVNGGGILRNGGGKIPLPDMKEMDWSSLVDTATKAMTQLSETVAKSHPGSNVYYDDISQVLNGVHNQHQLQQHQQQQSGHNGTMNGGGNGPLGTIVNGGGGGAGGSSSVSGTGSSIGSGVDLSSSTPSSASPVSTGSSTAAAQQQALMALQNSSSLPELQCQVTQLSDRVLREQRRRRSLEHAVKRLTEENRRLQDESQAAVQQLRRFTEWFFQTIDRQS
ncbi:signal-induced proliferation-associated 1-like protein 1 isoform X2 [Anopheles merus]|uniref:signal-induced proliferation-associated 1-like protein 1 isoform X2 n=1 Tax=Anopheles merus TaxID=30066 RepID=UPI001BE419A1|nr:signal-induced proliferation-associated 1-like protein 1 isoform X2 [Anopheles merus]